MKLDTDDNEEHARRVAKEAWGFVMRQMVTEMLRAIQEMLRDSGTASAGLPG